MKEEKKQVISAEVYLGPYQIFVIELFCFSVKRYQLHLGLVTPGL